MQGKYGLLTEIQLKTLYYKSMGLSYRRISEIIGTSHQNIAVAYRRALKNIETANDTIMYYNLITSKFRIVVKSGIHLADIPRLVFKEADEKGLKIRSDFTLLFKLIRFHTDHCIEGSKLKCDLLVLVDQENLVHVYVYKSVKKYIEDIEKLVGKDIIDNIYDQPI